MYFPALLVTCGLRDYGTATWEGGDDECEHIKSSRQGKNGQRADRTTGHDDIYRDTCKCGAKRIDNQLGLEPTPETYLENMVQVFQEVKRVLRDDGCLFLNMGDSYAGSWGAMSYPGGSIAGRRFGANNQGNIERPVKSRLSGSLKAKDLCMMPARLAMALQADGWYLRSMMPWVKRSAMPESCTDRPASALEYVFLLTKSSKYFFDMDAIRVGSLEYTRKAGGYEDLDSSGVMASANTRRGLKDRDVTTIGRNFRNTDLFYQSLEEPHGAIFLGDEMVGLDVNPHAYKESHFATFPPKLIVPLIKAGTSERGCCVECSAPWERVVEKGNIVDVIHTNKSPIGQTCGSKSNDKSALEGSSWMVRDKIVPGHTYENKTIGWEPSCKHQAETKPCVVFDPFGGSGTVKDVAERLGRKAIIMDLSYEYCQQAKKRCVSDQMSLI